MAKVALDDLVWLDTPELWRRLAKVVRKAGICGLDTEFYNVDVTKQSCVGRATVHVWSLAVRTATRSPLGYHRAVGWVLPVEALVDPNLKAILEDATITKCVHNQPVDDHALHNHGVKLRGAINTLGLARWEWPELVREDGFGLKNLMNVKLHRDIVCTFDELVTYGREEVTRKTKIEMVKKCECGVEGCRLRKARGLDSHDKYEEAVEVVTVKTKEVEDRFPLESIVPGHERWELLLKYAAEDAVACLEVEELARQTEYPAPWPPWPGKDAPRPTFNQGVEDKVVEMERTGFPVDVPWCRKQLEEKVYPDEEAALDWLFRWYLRNSPFEGPHRREPSLHPKSGKKLKNGVDALWASPTKLVKVLDLLDVPRSPIWKKGRVKEGEVKTDETAMMWIAEAMPEMATFVKHFVHLKRIRSGKKYLTKLANSGGHVNTICGPAGDNDDAVGAITGRLGIKGVLEAQQLPKPEDKPERDVYTVRRAIVANPVEVNAGP